MQPPIIIAPSLLACDFSQLAVEVRRAETAGGDWLHCDVMDGHFVDNISFGPAFVAAAKIAATKPLDVHLMVERPDHFFPRFLPAASNITVHVEAAHDVAETLAAIRASGRTAGLALNPATPLSDAIPYVEAIDLLLVMTVHPGFGGQPFRAETMKKVTAAANLRTERGLQFHIQVDGGINVETARVARQAGANVFVGGTALFNGADMAAGISAMRAV